MTPSEEFLEPLKKLGTISGNETLESLFKRPYNQLEKILVEALLTISNTLHNDKLFQLMIIIGLNRMIEEGKKHLESDESKVNANKIEKLLQNKAFIALNPLILSLFKWDFNRRIKVWEKQGSDFKYEKEYITKAVNEIEDELEGTSKVIASKYMRLILEFLEDFFNTILSNISLQELKSNRKDQFFEAFHKLSEILEKDNINEIVDEDLEVSASKQISEKSKLFKDGLMKFSQSFDFISNAFVQALIEYKVFLEQEFKSLEDNNGLIPFDKAISQARNCCGEFNTDKALDILMAHPEINKEEIILNELIHQKARWISVKRDIRLDIVDYSNGQGTLNKINSALLEFITEINNKFKNK